MGNGLRGGDRGVVADRTTSKLIAFAGARPRSGTTTDEDDRYDNYNSTDQLKARQHNAKHGQRNIESNKDADEAQATLTRSRHHATKLEKSNTTDPGPGP